MLVQKRIDDPSRDTPLGKNRGGGGGVARMLDSQKVYLKIVYLPTNVHRHISYNERLFVSKSDIL